MLLEPRLALDAAAAAMDAIHVTTLLDEMNPSDGLTSLREAVAQANAAPGSKIVLDVAGTYRLSLADPLPGDGTTDIDITASVTISPCHFGSSKRFIIDGSGLDRIFDIHGAVDVVLKNLTFRNGSAIGDGGAIAASDPGAELTLCGDKFLNNRASGAGGAVFTGVDSYLWVDRCCFQRNIAGSDGGAIASVGFNVNVEDSVFFRNQAGGRGGAVFFAGQNLDDVDPLFVCGSKFLGNHASGSGGAVFDAVGSIMVTGIDGGSPVDGVATVSVRHSCFATNSSGNNGGAVAVEPLGLIQFPEKTFIIATVTVEVADSTFVANSSAADGGGVSVQLPDFFFDVDPVKTEVDSDPPVRIEDSCFLVNRAGGDGGGVSVELLPFYATPPVIETASAPIDGEAPLVLIDSCRFVANRSAFDGGGASVRLTPFDSFGKDGAKSIDQEIPPALKVVDTCFLGNTAGGDGGGLSVLLSPFDNFEENGAKSNDEGIPAAVEVVDTSFLANTAGGDGGGMSVKAFVLRSVGGEDKLLQQPVASGSVVVLCSRFIGNISAGAGGGLWVENVPGLTVEHSQFCGNRAAIEGGGIGYEVSALGGADFSLSDSCISNNVVTGVVDLGVIGTYGGGVSFDFDSFNAMGAVNVDISRTEISKNSVGGSGGGLFLRNQVSSTTFNVDLFQLCVSSNSAAGTTTVSGNGGGIDIEALASGSIVLDQSTIAANRATNEGGGVYLNQPTGTTAFNNSTFSCNSAVVNGGGIFVAAVAPQSLTMTNDTVSGNTTSGNGGGIYVESGAVVSLINVTIAQNQAGMQGGGIFNNGGVVNVLNTIIATNFVPGPPTDGPDVFGTFVDQGFNLIGIVDGSVGFNVSTLVGTSAMPLDPRLEDLEDNGGPTKTMALRCGSPAIDAGTTGVNVPTLDQRGVMRDSLPDIGAYEKDGCRPSC